MFHFYLSSTYYYRSPQTKPCDIRIFLFELIITDRQVLAQFYDINLWESSISISKSNAYIVILSHCLSNTILENLCQSTKIIICVLNIRHHKIEHTITTDFSFFQRSVLFHIFNHISKK